MEGWRPLDSGRHKTPTFARGAKRRAGRTVPSKEDGIDPKIMDQLLLLVLLLESWQNGYCTSLENWRPQGLGGSSPSLSARLRSWEAELRLAGKTTSREGSRVLQARRRSKQGFVLQAAISP